MFDAKMVLYRLSFPTIAALGALKENILTCQAKVSNVEIHGPPAVQPHTFRSIIEWRTCTKRTACRCRPRSRPSQTQPRLCRFHQRRSRRISRRRTRPGVNRLRRLLGSIRTTGARRKGSTRTTGPKELGIPGPAPVCRARAG